MTMRGCFSLVLHSHIPFVLRHGQWPHGMDWLLEATCESYLPLLQTLRRLSSEGIRPSITVGLTPVLLEQLASGHLREALPHYIDERIDIANADLAEFERSGQPAMADLARFWTNHYSGLGAFYRGEIKEDIVNAFSELHRDGQIELITSAATHAYLPLLGRDISISAQVKTAKRACTRLLGFQPSGFWMPECAYRPRYRWKFPLKGMPANAELRRGTEEFLADEGFSYFFIDSHLLHGGKAIGTYADRFHALRRLLEQYRKEYRQFERSEFVGDCHRVYLVDSSGEDKPPVAAFTRDPTTSLQVWSGEHGYPGDGWYLDFHKKHFPGGLRYWRVTDSGCDLANKALYRPDKVRERYQENASHFADLVRREILQSPVGEQSPPIVVSPYDTELFGHWWFEGIDWIEAVIRRIHQDPDVTAITCSEYLEAHHPNEVIHLPEGSWGEGGYHFIWLNEDTEWTWRHIYPAEDRMIDLAKRNLGNTDAMTIKLLKGAAIQLLLLQSSDWQFLISTKGAPDYAEARFLEHLEAFNRLCDIAEKVSSGKTPGREDMAYLETHSGRDEIFPDIELEWFTAPDPSLRGGVLPGPNRSHDTRS